MKTRLWRKLLSRRQPAPVHQEPKPSWEKEWGRETPPNASSLGGKQLSLSAPFEKEAADPTGVAGWEMEGLGPEASWQQRLGGYIPSGGINNQPVSVALISLSWFVFFLLFVWWCLPAPLSLEQLLPSLYSCHLTWLVPLHLRLGCNGGNIFSSLLPLFSPGYHVLG